MSFTGKENHDIPLAEASAWTARYRASITPGDTIGAYYGKDAIQAVLNQAGVVGIRIYYALDDANKKQLIIVGVNPDGNDVYQGLLVDRGAPCPDKCSSANPLNT